MHVPLDDALLAQTLDSKLCVSANSPDRPPIGRNGDSQDTTPKLTPDDGRSQSSSPPARARSTPRTARNSRPTSPITRPRTSWTWTPGNPPLMRLQNIARRQSPGRFQGLSRSISPRRCLAADYRYRSLLEKALLLDTAALVSGENLQGLHGDVAPYFSIQDVWPREKCGVTASQIIHGLGSLEGPVMAARQAAEDDRTTEGSDDSLLDETDQPGEELPRLDPNHRWWRIKDSLVHHAQAQFAQCYPDIQVEVQKRQTAIFACPFFRKDPARYWPCLADTSLVSIREVKRHLWRHHSQPYYCPVCYGTFPLASERDAHITQRTCQKKELARFDGMTQEQKTLISVRCKGHSGQEQWRIIWSILFGQPLSMPEPFLPAELSWNITLVTEFWEARGREITEEFIGELGMTENGLPGQSHDDSAISGLVNVILQDLVGLTFWRPSLVRNLGNIPAQELAI